MTAIRRQRTATRQSLIVGVSATALLLAAAPVQAGNGLMRKVADPAAAALAAAQKQATQGQQITSMSQDTLASFARAAALRQSMDTFQAAARSAAAATRANVPNGLGAGGLQMAAGATPGSVLWQGANAPTQSVGADERTEVNVQQTASQAILNWQTFNVGQQTDLSFAQQSSSWVVLNRVTDPNANPTQILGTIKAPGTVLIMNANGVIFTGTSQINVGALVAGAAHISDSQFLTNGVYSPLSGSTYLPAFTDAGGAVTVQAGAQLTTAAPTSVTNGGGFVLLMGKSVENDGSIITPDGQTEMVAGDNFLLRPGFGTDGNQISTTMGNEIAVQLAASSGSGAVTNAGVIEADTGDITLAGQTIVQGGLLIATTSVNQRGTIHLLTSASDPKSSVTLTPGSLTLIALDDSGATALDAQRDALISESQTANQNRPFQANAQFDDLSQQSDRLDQSRVEIVSGGSVEFQGQSLTLAQGGQIAVSAAGRAQADTGAVLDVSGAAVTLSASASQLLVNVQGNEVRDAPVNRDSGALFNDNLWVDARDLVYLPPGTGGDTNDVNGRDYTAGGLLEVSGYLGTQGHTIGEWASAGGTISFQSGSVVAQKGADFNISGGAVNYQAGDILTSMLQGSDGHLYSANSAPANLQYSTVGPSLTISGERWGTQYDETFQTPLTRSTQVSFQDAYSDGKDGGSLILGTPTSVFEGDIDASVVMGPQQTQPHPTGAVDSYSLAQSVVPTAGKLALGEYSAMGLVGAYATDVRFNAPSSIAGSIAVDDPIPDDRVDTAFFDAGALSASGLGGLSIATQKSIVVTSPLTFAPGAQVNLTSAVLDVAVTITDRGGSITASNVLSVPGSTTVFNTAGGDAFITLDDGAAIDTRGLWTNALIDPATANGAAFIDGGAVSLSTTGMLILSQGAAIDTSSGGLLSANGVLTGGKGGSVSLVADNAFGTESQSPLVLGGRISGYGVSGGGTLTLQAPSVTIGGAAPLTTGGVVLPSDYFDLGFSDYVIAGVNGLEVAPGAQVAVTMPVYRYTPTTSTTPTGADPASALQLWTPPLILADPATDTFTQRVGASIQLNAGGSNTSVSVNASASIGTGASISVDPGQTIGVAATGQLTVDGVLSAPGGAINLTNIAALGGPDQNNPQFDIDGRSIWVGSDAVLDAAGEAFTAQDQYGRTFGTVIKGGSVVLGTAATGADTKGVLFSADAFLVVRPGALIDVSGASATFDSNAQLGMGLGGFGRTGAIGQPLTVASDAGSVTLSSYDGIYLDGTLKGDAGGPGAAGGTFSALFVAPNYFGLTTSGSSVPDAQRLPRQIIITQATEPSGLSTSLSPGVDDPSLVYGQARISADALNAGGFSNLVLTAPSGVVFHGAVNLTAAQSITLNVGAIADASAAGQVTIDAPYVQLNSSFEANPDNSIVYPGVVHNLSQQSSTGTLTVSADLIDISGQIAFGASGAVPQLTGAPVSYDFAGFQTIRFQSNTDIRLSSVNLFSPGDFDFTSAQLYGSGQVFAGASSLFDSLVAMPTTGTINVTGIGGTPPPLPSEEGEALALQASVINQDGVVRDPLGTLTFSAPAINFLPGSVTSVSANGLTIPYGGTPDGVNYTGPNGALIAPGVAAHGTIVLQGQSVDVQAGATLDFSGGGTLQGAGFVSGRGGSVDVLTTPLANAGPGYSLSKASDQVYAIVPSYTAGYAPSAMGAPSKVGEQITIPAGVPGLPAGTYTLLPASYALLPGGFRVELGGAALAAQGTALLQDGTYVTQGIASEAFTSVKAVLPIQVLITPGQTVLTYSGYNQTSYADYQIAQAAIFGAPRPLLPQDAGDLTISYLTPVSGSTPALTVDGAVLTTPAAAGYGSTVDISGTSLSGTGDIEIYAAAPTPGFTGVSLSALALNALNAADLLIGVDRQQSIGATSASDPRAATQQTSFGNAPLETSLQTDDTGIVLRSGATLAAPEVVLVSGGAGVTLEPGASINTIGQTVAAPPPPPGGYIISPVAQSGAILAVSNQDLISVVGGAAPITLGAGSSLYSTGSIFVATSGSVSIADGALLGTRELALQATTINIGDADALAGAVVPPGLTISQSLLDGLLQGDANLGVPGLTQLKLNATQSVDVFGTIDLSVGGGASSAFELDLTAPAIYGYGGPSDVASLSVGKLVWTGSTSANPSAAIAGGPGTGSGTLDINAGQIVFGHPTDTLAATAPLSWSFLGFSSVNLTAGEITSNDSGAVTAYQAQDPLNPANGSGGTLNMAVGVLSGGAGTTLGFTAAGAVNVTAGPTAAPSLAVTDSLGGALSLAGSTVSLDAPVYLPSGALTLTGTGDVTVGQNARINLAGQSIAMFDQTVQTPGGAFLAQSASGGITLAAGSSIDVSAPAAAAGSVTLSALQGAVSVGGTISGGAPTPDQSAAFAIAGHTIGDFDGLNAMLDAGGVFGQRSFEIGQGDLTVDGTIKAHEIDLSVDGGSLTVNGTLDASGPAPGTIALAAGHDLTLGGSAVLDAHGTQLQVDSYGAPIEAENRGHIALTSTGGTLTLGSGATLNLSTPDGVAYGDVELNAPRSGGADIAVSASGTLNISGAATIALNAFRTYTNAPSDPNAPANEADQFITQAYLDGIDADSQAFINGAGLNGALLSRISGLTAYGADFHLRPGVEIKSATSNGDLTLSGDIDLSAYRYGPGVNPAVYGSGEPGVLLIRAGGNLNVDGSLSDGFTPPPATPDDNGWSIITKQSTSSPIALTIDVPLAGSASGAANTTTTFNITSPTTVGYDLPIRATSIDANALISFPVTTSADFTFATVWTTSAPITLASGTTIPRGTIEPAGAVIPAGSMLGAGTVLPGAVGILATTVPAGTQLDIFAGLSLSQNIIAPAGQILPAGTTIPAPLPNGTVATTFTAVQPITLTSASLSTTTVSSLTYAVPISRGTLQRGVAIPFAFKSSVAFTISTPWTAAAQLVTPTHTYNAGDIVPAGTSIPSGSSFAAGSVIPVQGATKTLNIAAFTVPAGTPLDVFSGTLPVSGAITIPAGGVVPAGSTVTGASAKYSSRPLNAGGTEGQIDAVAPMLPAGDLSWSLQLTAGANLAAADARGVNSPGALDGAGNLVLDDAHFGGANLQTPSFSVLRTGTGSLSLVAGGNIREATAFGIYTAGTQSAGVAPQYDLPRGDSGGGTVLGSSAAAAPYAAVLAQTGYQAYYPAEGGDVQVSARGDLTGSFVSATGQLPAGNGEIGDWLWRQGGADGQLGAWWINFGTYALPLSTTGPILGAVPGLTGFTGIGALGGGNVQVTVGGNAGNSGTTTNQAITVADASTGRVQADGSLLQTGGGDVTVKVAGALNAFPTSAAALDYFQNIAPPTAGGVFTDLRGDLTIQAGSIGGMEGASQSANHIFDAYDGILLTPGDGLTTVTARGQMVIAGYADGGRAQEQNTTPYSFTTGGTTLSGNTGGFSDFTLWTNTTQVHLLSIGGDVDPQAPLTTNSTDPRTSPDLLSDGHAYAPGVLAVAAPVGDIVGNSTSLELAPSTGGGLSLLAGQSIYNISINVSGADPGLLATPFQPAFGVVGQSKTDNYSLNSYTQGNVGDPLLAFGPDTPTSTVRPDAPAPIYAVNGDIVNLQLGQMLTFNSQMIAVTPSTWYVAGQPANIRAGEDIVDVGGSAPVGAGFGISSQSGLVLNLSPTDISTLQAGRDIIYSSMAIAGPGDLVVQAGRNFYGGQFADLHSVGPLYGIQAEDRNAGAGITLLAGVGAQGPDYADFAKLYFDPANQADTVAPLAGQPGKVDHVYSAELLTWLQRRFGYAGSASGALAYFLTLPTQQQGIFVRQVYYEELDTSGKEFNDPASERFKSYLRGEDAIATLFPAKDAAGQALAYQGDITLFSALKGITTQDSGIHTDFGGAIQLLDPGGQATLGVAGGVVPGADAGLLTQGSGDIDIYTLGSVLLGQSRILTTFGGDILIWSATGDINGGQGSKSTILFTPPSRLYNDYGQVSLAPTVPSTGAGIGTLNPIPEVPRGDINLVAPLGTVDAGEAGIRVSGSINIAALHVVNAANIQVQGTSTGIPTTVAVNTGALSAAAAASSAVTSIAEDLAKRAQPQPVPPVIPTIVTVQVLGFGE